METSQSASKQGVRDSRRLFAVVFLLFAVVHVLSAVLSTGFFHPDEHFQVIEFASYKLGITAREQLAWEFGTQIRPWLQPAMFYGFHQAGVTLGVKDPFDIVTGFRIFAALLNLGVMVALFSTLKFLIKDARAQTAALVTWALFYVFPMLHARTSSENFSTMAVTMALVCSLHALYGDAKKRTRLLFVAGVMAGLAFEFRYQIAFMVVGLYAWLLVVAKARVRELGVSLLGVFLVVIFCTAMDAWGYGSWTFAPWNYVKENLIRGKAAEYGTGPWYQLFELWFESLWQPLSSVAFAITILGLIVLRRSVVSWMGVPFLFAHLVVGHKEFRFLFPLLQFMPLLLAQLFDEWHRDPFVKKLEPAFKATFVTCIAINCYFMLRQSFRPLTNELDALSYLRRHGVRQFYLIGDSIFHLRNLPYAYYVQRDITEVPWRDDMLTSLPEREFYVVKNENSGMNRRFALEGCEGVDTSVPMTWQEELLRGGKANNWLMRDEPYVILRCTKTSP